MASKSRHFEKQDIFIRPMCLIHSTEEGKFSVDVNVLRQIQEIDVPLVVVAIVGLCRTGKSYLMNRLAGVSQGFPLGNSVESKTKGIWAWCHKHPTIPDAVLLLLDTEGLGDVAKGDQRHDNSIFTLALLLCNVFVYNVMTALNQDVIEKLTFISELSKNIRFSNKSDVYQINDQLELILPTFVLCIRDFSLALNIGSTAVTADLYLEYCLQPKQEEGSASERERLEQYNRIRQSIRKYFPTRKCFTFDAPGTRTTLQKLEALRLDDLSKEFVEETNTFLAYIYGRKPKMLLTSKPVTGKMFVPLVETYVKAINAGAVPDVDGAIEAVARIENKRMIKIATKKFKEGLLHIRLPVLQEVDFDKMRQDLQNLCLDQFRLESVFDKDGKYESQAIEAMHKIWDETKAINEKLLKQHWRTRLKHIYSSVTKKKQDGAYSKKGGYIAYKRDIAETKLTYKREVKHSNEVVAMKVLHDFMEEEETNETKILQSDQHYSEEERQMEMLILKREHQKAQKQLKDMFERRIKQEAKRAEKHKQNLKQQMQENITQNRLQLQQLTELWSKDRELYSMQIKEIQAEHNEEREACRRDMAKMKEELDEQKKYADALILPELREKRFKVDYLEEEIKKLTHSQETEKEKYAKVRSELARMKQLNLAHSERARELENKIKAYEDRNSCVIQ